MKSLKTSSLFRMAALLIVAIIVICMVGFVAQEWQEEPEKQPDSGETDENSGNTDENTDGNDATVTPDPPAPPEYTHYLTGLETTADEQRTRPLCFVMNSASPLYGISNALLTVEIPIENGGTRLLVYRDHSQHLGKIGSIAEGRECILRLLQSFGGIAIHNGTDSTKDEQAAQGRPAFDLSLQKGYAYTENASYLYSNGDLLYAGLQNAGISLTATESCALPFRFAPFFTEPIRFSASALTVVLPYSDTNETDLYYDAQTHRYTLGKNGQTKTDLLNGKSATYKNAFVLFADTTTYESMDHTEMITDTASGGSGYYFTEGTATAILWRTDASGNLIFTNESGELLTVNRGESYIAFFKSSKSTEVLFS